MLTIPELYMVGDIFTGKESPVCQPCLATYESPGPIDGPVGIEAKRVVRCSDCRTLIKTVR